MLFFVGMGVSPFSMMCCWMGEKEVIWLKVFTVYKFKCCFNYLNIVDAVFLVQCTGSAGSVQNRGELISGR